MGGCGKIVLVKGGTSWSDVGNPVVKQLLLGHVNDPDWRVRMEVVERLADQEDEVLLTPFLNATSDSHPYVRQAAVQALGKRSGFMAPCRIGECSSLGFLNP